VKARWESLRESLRSGFWAVPSACVAVAVLASLGLVALDRRLQAELAFTFGAGPDGAREVLSAITTAMITFTGLVFSITVVVLQLTSSQFSPRVLRTFLRDRQTQYALGVFTATFVYSVMVLRTVNSGDDDEFVPAAATTFALVLLLVSVGLFVSYIHHIATAVQASSIITAIGAETRDALDRRFPPGRAEPVDAVGTLPPDDLPALEVPAPTSGVLTTIDESRLVDLACAAGVVLRTQARVGDFLPEGAPMLDVLGDPADLDVDAVVAAFAQAQDRTLQQDVAFGFRQLVDVAERALSPSMNDPTTAVQVLDQLHDLLRRLVTRPLRTGLHADDDGAVRLVVPPDGIRDYLALALDGIEQHGEDARPVQERLDALLVDVAAAALPQHRDAVERRRAARARA
jgi:uncharacterized membrane protein